MSLDDLQGRRLASPVGAEEGVELATLDVEGQILHGVEVAVDDVELVHLDDRAGRHLCVEHTTDRHGARAVQPMSGSTAANLRPALHRWCPRSVAAALLLDGDAVHWSPAS